MFKSPPYPTRSLFLIASFKVKDGKLIVNVLILRGKDVKNGR